MSTPQEHYEQAERILRRIELDAQAKNDVLSSREAEGIRASALVAQVHATLATVKNTAVAFAGRRLTEDDV